jgi:uncharacterized protein YebE (UPF0316 family)
MRPFANPRPKADTMDLFLSTLAIFMLRLIDVSISSVRIITLMRGRIGLAALMGFFESGVWVTAAAIVFTNLDNPIRIVGFAAGFAVGTLLGGNIERWLAMGTSMIRIVTSVEPGAPTRVAAALREAGFPLTVLNAEGRDGEVRVTLMVLPRRRVKEALAIIAEVNPQAFTTVEDITVPEIQRHKRSGVRK